MSNDHLPLIEEIMGFIDSNDGTIMKENGNTLLLFYFSF